MGKGWASAARALLAAGFGVGFAAGDDVALAADAALAGTTLANTSASSTDRAIERMIRSQLDRACALATVDVDVAAGTVVLTGTVASTQERVQAESVARATGATRIDDRIAVDLVVALAARADEGEPCEVRAP